jgi:hypothetical protein
VKDPMALCFDFVSAVHLLHFQFYPYRTGSQFDADVAFFARAHGDVSASGRAETMWIALPSNCILFTFDGGLAPCHDVIQPILKRYGNHAIFFVTIDHLYDAESFFEYELSRCLWEIERLDSERARSILAAANSSASLHTMSPKRRRMSLRFGLPLKRSERLR